MVKTNNINIIIKHNSFFLYLLDGKKIKLQKNKKKSNQGDFFNCNFILSCLLK